MAESLQLNRRWTEPAGQRSARA